MTVTDHVPGAIRATLGAARSRTPARILAFTPLWVWMVLTLSRPVVFEPMYRQPSVAGIPLGVFEVGMAFGWMLIGVGLVWDARSPLVDALAYALFTLPATLAVVFLPALVLILQNQG